MRENDNSFVEEMDVNVNENNNINNNAKKVFDIPELKDKLFGDTYEAQADKIQEIYDSLEDENDKLEFLIETKKYIYLISSYEAGGSGRMIIPDAFSQKLKKLDNDYYNNYVKDGLEGSLLSKCDKINSMKAVLNANILADYEKYLKELPENDPNREKKAMYLARTNPENASTSASIKDAIDSVEHEYCENKLVLDDIKDDIKLDSKTKISKIVDYIGYNNEAEKNNFYTKYEANPNQIALPALRKNFVNTAMNSIKKTENKKLEKNKEDQKKKEFEDLFDGNDKGILTVATIIRNEKFKSHKSNSINNFLNNSFFNDEQKKNYFNISSKLKKDMSQGSIMDWIENEASAINEARQKSDLINFVNKYTEKYNDIKKNVTLKEGSKRRIKKATSESYEWLVEDFVDEEGNDLIQNPTDQQRDEYTYDIKDDFSRQFKVERSFKTKVFSDEKIRSKILNADDLTRNTSTISIFQMWAMATHDNIDANNIKDLSYNGYLVSEFADFCEKNPTRLSPDRETYEKSIKNWCDVFSKATEKLKNYKIPKVNYENEEELKQATGSLFYLSQMVMDFRQEYTRILTSKHDLDGKALAENYMGEAKWNDMINTWSRAGNLLASFTEGYTKSKNFATGGVALCSSFTYAINRNRAISILKKNAGNTMGKAITFFGDKIDLYQNFASYAETIYDNNGKLTEDYKKLKPIEKKNIVKYLNGKDKKPFKNEVKVYEDTLEKISKDVFNQTYMDALTNGFYSDLNMGVLKDSLLNLNENADAVVAFLNQKEVIPGSKFSPMSCVADTFNKVLNEDSRCMLRNAGLSTSTFLTVDGKSFEEMWGDKYKNVADKNLKNRCYQVEMLKLIAAGKGEIRAKIPEMDNTGKMRAGKDIIVSLPSERLKNMKYNLDIYETGIRKMAEKLTEIKNALLTTHPDYNPENVEEAEDNIGKVGTKLFQNFEKQVNETIEILQLDNNENNSGDIKKKLLKLSEAVNTYHSKRKNLIFKKQSDAGQVRFEQSEKAVKLVDEMIRNYSMLQQGIDEDMICKAGRTFENASFRNKKSLFESLKDPKINVYGIGEMHETANEVKEDIVTKREALTKALSEGIGRLGKNYNELVWHKGEPEPYDAALAYYVKDYIEQMNVRDMTEEKFNALQTEIRDGFGADNTFKKKAEKLSKNVVFKEFLKQNHKFDFKEWRKIEQESEKLRLSYKNDIESITADDVNAHNEAGAGAVGNAPGFRANNDLNLYKQEKDIVKYILTGDAAGKIVSPEKSSDENRYKRLGDYVSKQILTDPRNKVILDAIAAGKLKYENVLNGVVESFKKNNILVHGAINEEQLKRKLESGEFKNLVVESITKQAQSSAKFAKTFAAQKDIASPRIPNISNPQAGQGAHPGH
ncbi:MAG: hypothetical protein K6G11_06180 [Lachnospiraceae bacterium]|nr:hypothetical protein [Lachnospiraceae bacterium]